MAGGEQEKKAENENEVKEVGAEDEVENKENEEEMNGESETPKKSPSKSSAKSPKKSVSKEEEKSPAKSPTKSVSTEDEEEESSSKSPSKSGSKNEKEEESDQDMEDEESDEDEDEEELPPGLLERPLEIEGKREKKKTERLTSDALQSTPKEKKFSIEDGKGVKLGDIPVVQENLLNSRALDCKPLHHVLFLKVGKIHEVKKNIRQFSGEPNGKDSKEHEKRMILLNKFNIPQLKFFCQTLNMPVQGAKTELIDRLEEFILKPIDNGDKVAKPQKRKRSKTPSGKKTKKSKTDKVKKKKKENKEKKSKKAKASEEEELSDLSEDEDEAPKKKKMKLSPKKTTPAKSEKKKSPTKKDTPKKSEKKPKSPKKTPKKKKAEESDDSDSEDEPLARLKESPPSNSDIKSLVQKILKGADLEKVTMKTVVKQVYAKYPKFDLTDRKDFIKDSVRRIIS